MRPHVAAGLPVDHDQNRGMETDISFVAFLPKAHFSLGIRCDITFVFTIIRSASRGCTDDDSLLLRLITATERSSHFNCRICNTRARQRCLQNVWSSLQMTLYQICLELFNGFLYHVTHLELSKYQIKPCAVHVHFGLTCFVNNNNRCSCCSQKTDINKAGF